MASLRLASALGVLASLLLVTVHAVTQGAPYDDEIGNFHVVEGRDLRSIVEYANSVDVHPPGSFVINAILFRVLGSWDAVKIAGGCINALALAFFVWLASEKLTPRQRFWLTLFGGAAATTILWGASVRWYAYFNPIFTVSLGLTLFSNITRTSRTIALGAAAVLLFHTGYAAICAVPVLLIAHLGRDFQSWNRADLLALAVTGLVSFIVCLPQLNVFIHVHMHNQAGQVGGLLSAASQTALTLLLGNAVFPLAPAPIAAAIVLTATLGYWFYARPKSKTEWLTLAALVIGVVTIIVSGVGIKPRNSVFLLPLMMLLASASISALRPGAQAAVGAALILFQGLALWNVAYHKDTLKGSYNSDFRSALLQLRSWNADCARMVVFNHDPVMSYLLDDSDIMQSSPYERNTRKAVSLADGDCVTVVKTFHGVIPKTTLERMYALTESIQPRPAKAADIGRDRYFEIKTRLMHDPFPPWYIRMEMFRADRELSLPDWSTFVTPEGTARTAND